jgi:hypothetical protein
VVDVDDIKADDEVNEYPQETIWTKWTGSQENPKNLPIILWKDARTSICV